MSFDVNQLRFSFYWQPTSVESPEKTIIHSSFVHMKAINTSREYIKNLVVHIGRFPWSYAGPLAGKKRQTFFNPDPAARKHSLTTSLGEVVFGDLLPKKEISLAIMEADDNESAYYWVGPLLIEGSLRSGEVFHKEETVPLKDILSEYTRSAQGRRPFFNPAYPNLFSLSPP